MHKVFIFILLQIVTLYSVSAHYHFVMDNAGEYSAETLSGHYIDEHTPDFECDEKFYADNYVFYEEMASTRRPDEKFSFIEIGSTPTTVEMVPFPAVSTQVVYPRSWSEVPLISSYTFIVRLTLF